jgi:uncharacterized membrane protein|tara:strand:- start:9546 stop:10181 length:636 start_codon:yes stop_codon:yes gene_type:complete
MNNFLKIIRRNFISGLIIFIPFIITIYLIVEITTWLNTLVDFTPARFLDIPEFINPYLSQFIIFLIAGISFIAFITLIGLLTKNLLGKFLLNSGEKIISKIPLASTIFTTMKQVSKTIFSDGPKNQKAVLIEYPRKGTFTIGFATQDLDNKDLDKIPVFIPTSPNPTSGFLIFVPKEDIKELDISADDAFKLIVSGGLSLNEEKNISKYKL